MGIGETNLGLSDIYRTQHVKRWHILHTKRTQTTAEHGYMVAMIAMFIVHAISKDQFVEGDQLKILKWALMHDLLEVVTGDTVSPVKQATKKQFDELESKIDKKLKTFENSLSDELRVIVKLADYVDALKYLKEEGNNNQAKSIYNKLYKNMQMQIKVNQHKWSNRDWSKVHDVLDGILNGKETYIDKIL